MAPRDFQPSLSDVSPRKMLPFDGGGLLRREVFDEVRRIYHERGGFNLVCSDGDGNLVYGLPECLKFPCRLSCRECRKATLERSLHAGRPEVCSCEDQFALWGIPLMLNQTILGGLIVVGVPIGLEQSNGALSFDEACEELMKIAVEYNLTNREYLKIRRGQYLPLKLDQASVETSAISPIVFFRTLRPTLECAEEQLTTAILREHGKRAPEALGAILRTIRNIPALSRPVFLGYGMHLLSLMHENVQTASGRYSIVLEHSYTAAARLIARDDLQGVCEELESALTTLLDLLQRNRSESSPSHFARALSFMESHFHEPLNRQMVAQAAGISESHLSRLLRQKTGRSFTEILNRYRVDRSAQLLLRSHQNIFSIALEVGFSDQSYFGRVFRRYYGQTPDQFRQEHLNRDT